MVTVNTGYEVNDGFGPSRPKDLGRKTLFNQNTPLEATYSEVVPITPGLAFFTQAFFLPENRQVHVNLVSMIDGIQDGYAHGELYRPGSIFNIQRMTFGGAENWVIDPEHPQMLITLPGTYMFEVSDPDVLGQDFRLEYYTWFMGSIPSAFPVMR
jgi:hypothetical protein